MSSGICKIECKLDGREIFGALIAKLANLHSANPVLKEKMEKMSLELQEYEQLVKQLKV